MSTTEQCAGGSTLKPLQVRVLLATAALSSSVGLVLELMLVTQASYLLGDAALATGVVIGSFLAAMGLGAWLSQFITGGAQPQQALLRSFLLVELCLAPLCLLAPLALLALFSADGPYGWAWWCSPCWWGCGGAWRCCCSPACWKASSVCATTATSSTTPRTPPTWLSA